MKWEILPQSEAYFEISKHLVGRRRIDLLKYLFKIIAILPLALLVKLWTTFCCLFSVMAAGGFLLCTLGISEGLRELFAVRMATLGADLADWILLPLAVFTCLCRLILAFVVHPAFFIPY